MANGNGLFAAFGVFAIFVWLIGFALSIGVPVAVIYAAYELVLYLKRH